MIAAHVYVYIISNNMLKASNFKIKNIFNMSLEDNAPKYRQHIFKKIFTTQMCEEKVTLFYYNFINRMYLFD